MSTPTDTDGRSHREFLAAGTPDPRTSPDGRPDNEFQAAWADWHAAHERHRASPHGFLAVTHLHWLDSSPARLDGAPGIWSDEDDVVRLA